MSEVLWVVLPYLALGLLVGASVVRYAYDPMGWGTRSSQLFETRSLRWGSLLFHWGILFVLVGHVFGLVVPIEAYRAVGIDAHVYHLGADVLGGAAGLAAEAGLAVLIWRRLTVRRVRIHTSVTDALALALLFVVVGLGDLQTVVMNHLVGPYEYRTTVGPWVRELFTLHPDAALMAHVPLVLKLHVVASLVLLGVWPFTRLVHAFSLPLAYLRRAPIQYRSRAPRSAPTPMAASPAPARPTAAGGGRR
jgi:nitrate reductase gamma subunit